MCTVSDKIKFCTCAVDDITELNHYWILHRKVNGKNLMRIGEPMFEHYKLLADFETNNTILCNRLNEKDAFDKPIEFKDKDQFEVVFNNGRYDKRITHCFVYKNGKWIITEYDVFNLMNRFDEMETGIIKNSFADIE